MERTEEKVGACRGNRRRFLSTSLLAALASSAKVSELAASALSMAGANVLLNEPVRANVLASESMGTPGNRYKIKPSLNAYSFNKALRAGELDLFDLVDFCSELGFEGLDATGYYFPVYPEPPDDEYIYRLKKHAFLKGITIHGTGVRNDFALHDSNARNKEIQRVKNWIPVAQKLGATVIRIFSGREIPDGYSFEQVLEWMVPAIRTCAEFARQHGVIIGIQNHNHFLKTSDETIRLLEAVNSDWVGVVLDIGSLRKYDPYEEIKKLLPYAVSWQLKEKVWYGEQQVEVDMKKIRVLIEKHGYRGFVPIETLGEGDPKIKVKKMFTQMQVEMLSD